MKKYIIRNGLNVVEIERTFNTPRGEVIISRLVKKNRKYGLKNARGSIIREAREIFGVKEQPGENKGKIKKRAPKEGLSKEHV